jgi:hypothetical protein
VTALNYTIDFDKKYATQDWLGTRYNPEATEFRLWAPTAQKVELIIYRGGDKCIYPMQVINEYGVYSTKISGDFLRAEYVFLICHADGTEVSTVDPYAKAVTVNGERGVVADPRPTDVPWPQALVGGSLVGMAAPSPSVSADKAVSSVPVTIPVIYELHVRDFSIAENSGMENKGKFLALIEKGCRAAGGVDQITGLDYLKSLGVTHIQLMPIADFSSESVDESNIKAKYNWGYDPQNYNAIEGSYVADLSDPLSRIRELQTVIDILHENGLGVIMDVVYNHVYKPADHPFEQTVPGYYFRLNQDGSFHAGTGVGNETASERWMMRKYMIDSITYWVRTFKLDGLRFDLMGTHDYGTMNEILLAVRAINPHIIVLGEGWNMPMALPEDLRATQRNASKMPGIAFFNDNIRQLIKGGSDDASSGFVSGVFGVEVQLLNNIRGGQNIAEPYVSTGQVIQYVAAHDNLTLWDKLSKSRPGESEDTRCKRQNLANAIVLLAFGTAFIHAGQEFCRTKGGDCNSYKSSDAVNQFDWERVAKFSNVGLYLRELIKIRRSIGEFALTDFKKINHVFKTIVAKNGLIGYKILLNAGCEQGEFSALYVFHNGREEAAEVFLAEGMYKVLVRDQKASVDGLADLAVGGGAVKIEPLSSLVLLKLCRDDDADGEGADKLPWFAKAVGYEIFPYSFYDSNSDGYGDLNGVRAKLPYLQELGINLLWLTPIYDSPLVDSGYDIRCHDKIAEKLGTMEDFKHLLIEAHQHGIRVIVDLVLNHTSDEHIWFKEAIKSKDNPYHNYYYFFDPVYKDGKRYPPCNWKGFFSESAFTYVPGLDQYYLHIFDKKMPDLNYTNPAVLRDMAAMAQRYIDMGVDGFRLDAISHLSKDLSFSDSVGEADEHGLVYDPSRFSNRPKLFDYLKKFKELVFAPNQIFTIGEVGGGCSPEDALKYADRDDGCINMVFNFDTCWENGAFWSIDKTDAEIKPNVVNLKRLFRRWYEACHDRAWMPVYWLNHDHPRVVSQYGNVDRRFESATMLATVLLFLYGTPFIYQGEELGLSNVTYDSLADFTDVGDVNFLRSEGNKYGENELIRFLRRKTRLSARAPIPWSKKMIEDWKKHAPLPVYKPNSRDFAFNEADQEAAAVSILKYFKAAIGVRRAHTKLIISGMTEWPAFEDERIFAVRHQLDSEDLLMVANFTGEEAYFEPVPDINFSEYDILLNNCLRDEAAGRGIKFCDGKLNLPPYAAYVFYKE